MTAEAYDQQRTKDLEAVGYRVVRVWNNEVFKNIQGVMKHILILLKSVPPDKKPSSPALLP
jgi:very-short-patch-repair endonuclease